MFREGHVWDTNRTHWSLRVAYSSDEAMRLGLPSVKGWRTLTGSVNDLYEAHLVVYDELFPIGIFYRRVIRLNGAN